MNVLLFFLFIAVAIIIAAYFLSKTSSPNRTALARKKRADWATKNRQDERMTTAANNRLGDRDAVWQARKRHLTMVSESNAGTADQRFFGYEPNTEPEYDGYSRADRHHLTPANIKPEGRIDDIDFPGRPRPAPD